MVSSGKDADPWLMPEMWAQTPPRWHRVTRLVAMGFGCLSLPLTLVAFAYLAGEPRNQYEATHPASGEPLGVFLRVCVLASWLVTLAASFAPSIHTWFVRRRNAAPK